MKTKKNIVKQRKKKSVKESSNSTGIRKVKKVKNVKKIKNNDAVLETLKKDLHEQSATKKPIPNRQLVWNSYLKTFSEVEKLNKKQKQIMDFCTNKSHTPPKRKRKFLNFIRHSFPNQADVTDEQINELFESLLNKYNDFKSGSYRVAAKSDKNCNDETKPKLSVNKKKKLKRAAAKALLQNSSANIEGEEEKKIEKVKLKRKKRAKVIEMDVDG